MHKIKVSVIVPVYNSERYLKKCIQSIVDQTLKEIEIIIINDGSTDNSENIVKSFDDNRIKYIKQANSGQSVCRNRGIELAAGEYIGFVDSDDWIDLDFYEKLYNSAVYNNADIAVAGILRVNKFKSKFHLKIENATFTKDIYKKFELCDIPEKCYVCNKIYKLEKLKSLGIKFEENRVYEDVLFTPQILYKMESLVTVPDTYYYYRRTANSTVTRRDEKANSDSKYMHAKCNEFIKENNIDIDYLTDKTVRYRFCGLTIFKIRTKGLRQEYSLFNIIKWRKIKKVSEKSEKNTLNSEP